MVLVAFRQWGQMLMMLIIERTNQPRWQRAHRTDDELASPQLHVWRGRSTGGRPLQSCPQEPATPGALFPNGGQQLRPLQMCRTSTQLRPSQLIDHSPEAGNLGISPAVGCGGNGGCGCRRGHRERHDAYSTRHRLSYLLFSMAACRRAPSRRARRGGSPCPACSFRNPSPRGGSSRQRPSSPRGAWPSLHRPCPSESALD